MMDPRDHSFKKKTRAMRALLAAIFLTTTLFSNLGHTPIFASDQDASQPAGNRIDGEAFIASTAGQQFQAGEFEKAVESIEELLAKYPGDPLLRRYKAIALDRSGKSEAAILVFKELLSEDPAHVPTHFFLAEALERAGQTELAVKEWNYVVIQGEGSPYSWWAAEAIQRAGLQEPESPTKRKIRRWAISARYGYEYDSNVILRPQDKSLSGPRDQNAGRHTMNLSMRYRAYSRRDKAVDFYYSTYQSLHDDNLNEFNFHSEDFGLRYRQRIKVRDQDVTLGARYNAVVSFLDGDLFSYRNVWHLEADTRFTDYSRTLFFDRMTHGEYGPDGSIPSTTSRDGFYHDFGFTHYIYSKDYQKFVYLREEFNSAYTSGSNFDYIGQTTRVGVHTPIIKKKLDFDASAGLRFRHYNNFSSLSPRDTDKRRDINWDLYTAVTYNLTPQIQVRGYYRYVNAQNRNDFFEYRRHVGGTQLVYRLAF